MSKAFNWLVVGGGDGDVGDAVAVDTVNASAFGAVAASVSTIFFGESQRRASVSSCGCEEWNVSIGEPSRINNFGSS